MSDLTAIQLLMLGDLYRTSAEAEANWSLRARYAVTAQEAHDAAKAKIAFEPFLDAVKRGGPHAP